MQTYCYKVSKDTTNNSGFSNLIPWLFLNIFGIGLMRMMMKTAIGASSLTAGIGNQIIDTGQKLL